MSAMPASNTVWTNLVLVGNSDIPTTQSDGGRVRQTLEPEERLLALLEHRERQPGDGDQVKG